MKILLIYPPGKDRNPYSTGYKEYDFDFTYSLIKHNLLSDHPEVQVETIHDLLIDTSYYHALQNTDFDIYICDITTYNGNFLYIAGMLDGLNKPLILCSSIDHPPLPVTMNRLSLFYSETTLGNEFRTNLNKCILNLIKNKPHPMISEEIKRRSKAFISYAHADGEYLNRLMIHLKPLEKQNLIDIWQDKRLKTGDLWKDEIQKALEKATIAILLISADFLASDFIVNNELPPLLRNAQVNGTKILPVIISPCRFLREKEISQFQAINDPDNPLSLMSLNDREIYYDKLSNEIELSLNQNKT